MQQQTFWKIALTEGPRLRLWALDVEGSMFRCRVWPMDLDAYAQLKTYVAARKSLLIDISAPSFLAHPDHDEMVPSLFDAHPLFAPDRDEELLSNLHEFFNQVDPVKYAFVHSS